MKFKNGVVLVPEEGETVLAAAGEAGKAFSGMIRLNGSAALLAEHLQKETDIPALTKALTDVYDVSADKAEVSVTKLVERFRSLGLLTE